MSAASRFSLLDYAKSLGAALAGAAAAVWLQLPLPWFTGPLIAVAAANMLGARLPSPPRARDGGQWIIGTALGLYFTPDVVRALLQLAPWVGLTTLAMIALGLVAAWVLKRATGESGTTTFFAMAIGGASEMAAQAERYGGRVDRVAAAHSLRIMLVALIVPFALQWAGVQGTDPYRPAAQRFDPIGLVVLAAVTGGGAIALSRLRLPNVWMIGPLLVAGALSAGGYAFSSLPRAVIDGGQLLIGVALGSRFSPEFFRAAPRYLTAVALITLGLLGVAALYGWWLAGHAGVPVPTAILATTPGGIGEMAITAKVLALGAPIVAAFHSVRLAALVLLIGGLFRVVRRMHRRRLR
ncbi:MAG: AbrB family transcriptional regulator [Burkholderiaceae bacterium]|nr:AbrB family transcriptional regulator [Burkholderiaceae bacterium]